MVDKKPEDKKEKSPFSDSSEIFESIFKEATSEIQRETGKFAAKPGLKPKPKPGVKPKPEARPKAPTKLELESAPEPKAEPEQKTRPEAKPRVQPPIFKPRQDPIRRPVTRTTGLDEEETGADLLSTRPLVRSRIEELKAKEEPGGKAKKPKPLQKKGKVSPVLRIILLLLLLAVGAGGAGVYFGIIDLGDYLGRPEPAQKEAPKVAATKPSPAQTATKPPQPAAPKAVQPSQPQATPAEGPKPSVQPQPVQAPPKPAETLPPPQPAPPTAPPAVAPSQPPEVQAKSAPLTQPAVAKVETPSPPVQPPVKVEPPLAPVQPPVMSQPQTPPAPVQPPSVPKKAETQQPGSQPKEVAVAKTVPPVSGAYYPFSVYLGSFQNLDYLNKALSIYEKEGFSPYWTRVELGAKGTWYRVFTGYFRSAQEAEAFIQQKRIKDGEVKEMRYSNLIGTFGTKQAGEEKALALAKMGVSAYCIPAADGQVRLYSGSFITKETAAKNQAELNSRGINSEIVER